MFCPTCGTQLPNDAQFCVNCGTAVAAPAQPAVQAPVQEPAQIPGQAPVQPSAQAPAQAQGQVAPVYAAAPVAAPVPAAAPAAAAPAKSRKPLIIGIVAFAVVALAALGIVFFLNSAHAKTVDLGGGGQIKDPRVLTILAAYDDDHDGTVSEQEAAKVESLAIDNASEVNGLGVFPNLKALKVSGQGGYTIDITDVNSLETLDLSNSAQVETMSIARQPNLKTLNLENTNVAAFDMSLVPELETLNIRNSGAAVIDVSGNPKLVNLICDDDLVIHGLDKTQLSEYWVVTRMYHEKPIYNRAVGGRTECTATYDENNRLASVTYMNGDFSSYSYNVQADYAYDEAGNLTNVNISGGQAETVNIAYDANGLPTTVNSSAGRMYNYAYNDARQLTTVTGTSGGDNLEYLYSYGADGSLASVKFTGYRNATNRLSSFTYDGAGRLTSIKMEQNDAVSESLEYTYAGEGGELAAVNYSNFGTQGYSETFSVGPDGRYQGGSRTTTGGNGMLYSYPPVKDSAYTYDANGNLTEVRMTRSDDNQVEVVTYEYKRILASPDRAPVGTIMTASDPLIVGANIWRPWEDFENPRMFATQTATWAGAVNPLRKPL